MEKLTALSKLLITGILVGSGVTAYRTYGGILQASAEPTRPVTALAEPGAAAAGAKAAAATAATAE